jgi:hypothetical protein
MVHAIATALSAHGLNVRAGTGGVHTLYVVRHGSRESIEVFEIDGEAKPPVVTWIGCAVVPTCKASTR